VDAMNVEVWWRDRVTGTLEHAAIRLTGGTIELAGTVLPLDEPLEITYRIEADDEWRTRRVAVTVVDTETGIERMIDFQSDGHGRWIVHGEERPDLAGCIDVDLAFSPITNTLPIRRLGLDVDDSAEVAAAWVQWPSLEVTELRQRYVRTDADTFRYSCGDFTATIVVDDRGLVRDYEDSWEVVDPDR
jgi:uncharacterized protein